MPFPVRYYCPRCELIHTLQRSGYLADKSVTPFPLEGWTYTDVDGDYEEADGVRIVCGEDRTGDGAGTEDGAEIDGDGNANGDGCGEPFYLNFVRFENGEEVEPDPESERVELAPDGPRGPRTPSGPGGPGL